jgi:hypothetical protein
VNSDRFDALLRALAAAPSRRALIAAALGSLLSRSTRRASATPTVPNATPAVATPVAAPSVCVNPDRSGLQQRSPGDLVTYEELTGTGDPAFPPGARAWRVVYVSTGRDNTERTLVCGVVIAPASGPAVFEGPDGPRGRVVSWSHGTVGAVTRCQPSPDPATGIFGPMPVGFNLVAWSNNANGDGPTGTAENGTLAGMTEAGWIVTASDYYTDLWGGETLMPFILGKIEAANSIDLVRAAHHLMAAVDTPSGVDAYDVVTWGHSQGGHAALWTGQLLEPYATATASDTSPTLALSGVVAEAPASVFVVRPDDPGIDLGYGLLDWFAPLTLQRAGDPAPVALMFSYIFESWAHYAAGAAVDASAMPAFPAQTYLDLAAVFTPQAARVSDAIAHLCWSDSEVATLVKPFATEPFLVPALDDGKTIDGIEHGNFDEVCAGDPPAELAVWCDWLRFNTPGPRGTSPLPTLPRRGDSLAPVLIAAGNDDLVVHCVAPASAPDAVPAGNDCVPAALYDAMAADYCPDGDAQGHLTLSIWRAVAGVNGAGHDDIPGILATSDFTTPSFADSPLQRFMEGAFAGTLAPGCSATVVNNG